MHDRGRRAVISLAGLEALPLYLLLLFCLTLGARSVTGAGTLELRLGHPHYLLSDALCFVLVGVAGLVDRQLRLYRACARGMYGNPAEIVPKGRPGRTGQFGF